MIHPEALVQMYGYTFELLSKQAAGMTHAESLLQPSFAGNSFNWILGHIVSSRTFPLKYARQEPIWTDAQRARYRNGSANIIADGEGVIKLDELVAGLTLAQERLVQGLRQMSYADMCEPSGYEDNTVGDSLGYFYFHETHHVGQLMYVAQTLRKKGATLEIWEAASG